MLNNLNNIGNEWFPEINSTEFIESLTTGEIKINHKSFFQKVVQAFTIECKESANIICKILLICIICSIIKNIQSENQSSVSEIVFYVCYLMISTLIISEFVIMVKVCKETIMLLNSFNGVFVPIMMIFLGVSGNIVTASSLQITILTFIAIISNVTVLFFIPLILTATILGVISNISELVDVSGISNFIKKMILILIEISMISFVAILSLEGSLTESIDSVTAKTVKSVASNMIPVVGKLIR